MAAAQALVFDEGAKSLNLPALKDDEIFIVTGPDDGRPWFKVVYLDRRAPDTGQHKIIIHAHFLEWLWEQCVAADGTPNPRLFRMSLVEVL